MRAIQISRDQAEYLIDLMEKDLVPLQFIPLYQEIAERFGMTIAPVFAPKPANRSHHRDDLGQM